MSTLNDRDIRALNTQLVEPFNADQVQPASYDLRLGNEFIRFSSRDWHMIDLADMKDASAERVVADDKYVIEPGEFLLGETAEVVKCPVWYVGRLEGKSTIGRVGLLIHVTAGFVDPGWEGKLTLEIYNVRRVPIILRPGRLFCQMSWQHMAAPEKPYAGRYQGAASVEPGKPWEQRVADQLAAQTREELSYDPIITPSPLSHCCGAPLRSKPGDMLMFVCTNCRRDCLPR